MLFGLLLVKTGKLERQWEHFGPTASKTVKPRIATLYRNLDEEIPGRAVREVDEFVLTIEQYVTG